MFNYKKDDLVILGFIILFFVICLIMIRNFIVPLVFTLLLVYILNPLHKYINKNIFQSENLSSIFILILILILLILPVTYSMIELTNEINSLNDNEILDSLNNLELFLYNKFNLNLNLIEEFNLVIDKVQIIIKDIIYLVPKIIFDIFIILFFYYYFSKNYDKEIHFFQHIFENRKLNHIKIKFDKLINGIIYGQILIRLIQAAIGTLGFLLIGVNSAIFWGFTMFFMAFIPMVGTGIIWVPLAILYFLKSKTLTSILIILVGFIISLIDNFLVGHIVSKRTDIGPVFTLVSIFGGIDFFGIYGIILGPFIMGFLFVLLHEFFVEVRNSNPIIRKYIWTEEERIKFRLLKTEDERLKYIEKLNNLYQLKNEKKKSFKKEKNINNSSINI